MRFLHLVGALMVLTMSTYCSGQGWRNIVPLKSTKADVERLLGPATGDPPRYYLPENTVYFQYSNCKCGEKCKTDDWNVPPDTVIAIRVGMKGVVKLAELKIDLTHFKKGPGADDVPGSFVYMNRDEGLAIEGGGDYVTALIYGPRAKDDQVRCPANSDIRRTLRFLLANTSRFGGAWRVSNRQSSLQTTLQL